MEVETPDAEEAFQTPPMHAREAPTGGEQERPSGAVPSRASSTPGRDGEEEWMVRPIRKKRGVTRYEQEYSNIPRGQFNLEDFEGEYDSYHCFAAEEDGEQAANYEEVMKSKYKDEWMRAMQSEMKSLRDHDTWRLVNMPPGKKAVGCKWVYKIKRNPSDEIVKFKARLVAKGFTQRPGIDYTETFAPVARKESLTRLVKLPSFVSATESRIGQLPRGFLNISRRHKISAFIFVATARES